MCYIGWLDWEVLFLHEKTPYHDGLSLTHTHTIASSSHTHLPPYTKTLVGVVKFDVPFLLTTAMETFTLRQLKDLRSSASWILVCNQHNGECQESKERERELPASGSTHFHSHH